MKMRLLVFGTVFFATVLSAAAQSASDWNWPEDKATAEEKYVLYKDALKQDNYQGAKAPHLWLLKNVPNLHNSLYIDGAKIYEGLAELEKDKTRKMALQDSALIMYDLRIQYFNDEANVLNRKAFTAYKYYTDRQDKYPELYNIFKRTAELNGDKLPTYVIVPYMDVIRRYKATGGSITDEQVIDVYDRLTAILDKQSSGGDRTEVVKENLDKVFMATVNVDCGFIKNNLTPKLNANPSDINLAKKIMSLMYAAKCTDDEDFVKTVKIIFNAEPTYGLAYLIGVKSVQTENYPEATTYFKKAIELTEENTKKGEIYIKLGDIENIRDSKNAARSYYLQAVNADPTMTDAYKKIGDMYYNSFNECKGGENIVNDRAIFIAAYEMYRKAGDSQSMAKAKGQFPSKEEAFQYDLTQGDALKIGCWINETVSLLTRD